MTTRPRSLVRLLVLLVVSLSSASALAQPCGKGWDQEVLRGRIGHAMVYDSARDVTVLFGGYNGSQLGETWEWNGVQWTFRTNTGPSPRFEHAMAYDSARGVTVLFGGVNASDTWEWDGSAWTLRATTGPSQRFGHTMAYDSKRGVTVLF